MTSYCGLTSQYCPCANIYRESIAVCLRISVTHHEYCSAYRENSFVKRTNQGACDIFGEDEATVSLKLYPKL